MREYQDYRDYLDIDHQESAPAGRAVGKKPTKFRDEDSELLPKKFKPRQLRSGFGTLAKRTLVNVPCAENRALLKEAGFSWTLLSSRSIEQLEVFFRRAIIENRLDDSALQEWLSGKAVLQMHKITSAIRGRLFKEIVTREFVQKNPNIFLANPNLTGSIIKPLLMGEPTGEFSTPDHLVFLREGSQATLTGFMEDKKAIFETGEDELIEQLENEWNLWLLLSRNSEIQSHFRERVLEVIPSFPYRVNIASESEGEIWLMTTKDFGANNGQLLPWVRLFQSSVSNRSIEHLAEGFIKKRFLPRLIHSSD